MGFLYAAIGVLLGFAAVCALSLASYVTNPAQSKSIDTSTPSVQTQIEQKRRAMQQAARANKGERTPSAQDTNDRQGLPAGQRKVQKWVVLDLGIGPSKDQYNPSEASWGLQVSDASGKQSRLTLQAIRDLGLKPFCLDWHCVTGWTTPDVQLQGVPLTTLLEACGLKKDDSWTWLNQVGYDGYTVPVHRDDLDDAFLAVCTGDGQPLSLEHGGARLVCPQLFGWKSCKWLTAIELHAGSTVPKGFWERLGCHERGRVARSERWAPSSSATWTFLIQLLNMYYYVLPQAAVLRLMQGSSVVLGWVASAISLAGLKRSSRGQPGVPGQGVRALPEGKKNR